MALALTVDKIDSVPEALRSEYVEKDGKFHLNVDGMPDVTGLKSALQSERDRASALDKTSKEWAKLGKTPAEIAEMVEAARKKEEDAALKAGKFDEVLATHLGNAKQERDTAVGAAQKERDSALGIARNAIIGNNVTGALAKAKATAEGIDLLTERLGKRIDIKFGDDGAETVTILEADGKTPMVGSGKGGLATYDDLVKEATKNYPSLFSASGAGGSGTDPKGLRRDAGGKTISRADFEALGPIDRAAKMKDGFKLVD